MIKSSNWGDAFLITMLVCVGIFCLTILYLFAGWSGFTGLAGFLGMWVVIKYMLDEADKHE